MSSGFANLSKILTLGIYNFFLAVLTKFNSVKSQCYIGGSKIAK